MQWNTKSRPGRCALLLLLLWTLSSRARILTPDEYIKLVQDHQFQKVRVSPPRDRCMPHDSANATQQHCGLPWGSERYKGRCVQLLRQGPCPDGFWIVLHRQTNRAHCAVQECPEGSVFIHGECEELGLRLNQKHCNKTQQLIVNEYGDPECECPMGRVWHVPTAACYTPHLRDPCEKGFTLQVSDDGRSASGVCLENLCVNPGEVPMTPQCEEVAPTMRPRPDFRCYTISTTGPCKKGFLAVDPMTSAVVCTVDAPYAIYNPPSRSCSVGSMRDNSSRCRGEMNASMMASPREAPRDGALTLAVPTAKPGVYDNGNVCPDGYFFTGGTCIHLMSGV